MNLRELLGEGPEDVEVADLAFDNRAVRPGTLFFCVPGFTRDGHDFAPDAVPRGAAALVVQRPLGLGVPEVLVADVRPRWRRPPRASTATRRRGCAWSASRGRTARPRRRSCCATLLEAGGVRTGLIGTVKSIVGGAERAVKHTTPEAIDLQRTFAEMLAGGDARVRDGGLLARAGTAARRARSTGPSRCSPT